MLDLSTPTDHAGAYEWAAVLFAHVTVGLLLTAAVGALLRSAERAAWLVLICYAIGWEIWWQALGAGLADAAVDTTAVAVGATIAWAAWERRSSPIVVSVLLLCAVAFRGIRRRSDEKQG